MKVAVIVVAGSKKQSACIWPTYNGITPGLDHDLIVIHRDMKYVPESISNNHGSVIFENKCFDDGELPHRAFGAYRYYWNKYKDNYEFFTFVSDDVLVKRNNWLLDAISMLSSFDKLGFVGTQIFNGLRKQYPHPSHCRAPIWFGKSSALKQIEWSFNSDHDGEMKIADQFLAAGFGGAQIGNKVDLAYDSTEKGGFFVGDHIASILAKQLGLDIHSKVTSEQMNKVNNHLLQMLESNNDNMVVQSPFEHIGKRKAISQLQPFNGLIYDKSIDLVPSVQKNFNIHVLRY